MPKKTETKRRVLTPAGVDIFTPLSVFLIERHGAEFKSNKRGTLIRHDTCGYEWDKGTKITTWGGRSVALLHLKHAHPADVAEAQRVLKRRGKR